MGLIRITCREASRLQSQAMDRPLSFSERFSLRVHMSVCDACTAVNRQLAFLRKAIQQYPGPDD